MAAFPTRDQAATDRFFKPFRDPPPPQTFEIGFVLGGTVSVGAYTGGALDLFMEAVDAWYAKFAGSPPHRILLSHVGGASGGAVCAAILAIASNRVFQHVNRDSGQQADQPLNPFWTVWVESLSFGQLVDTSDIPAEAPDLPRDCRDAQLAAKPPPEQLVWGLLNASMIDVAKSKIVQYAQGPTNFTERAWIGKPLRVAATIANQRGIPYQLKRAPIYDGYAGNAFVEYDDFGWFAYPSWMNCSLPDGQTVAKLKRPDEFWVDPAIQGPSDVMKETVGCDVLADWAAASGALPVGLRARELRRPAAHYLYRPNVRIVDQAPPVTSSTPSPSQITAIVDVEYPEPVWSVFQNWDGTPADFNADPYYFTAVDGGTYNNDPFKIVHRALAGTVGSNPQSPEKATRAIFMIDPLVDTPVAMPPSGESMIWVARSVIGNYTAASRYLTADLEMFADQDVFSRFQLVPTRKVKVINDSTTYPSDGKQMLLVGEAALAGADLGAVAGWCSKDFRTHDYLLGRHNMLEYLQKELILRADNELFDGWFADAGLVQLVSAHARNSDGSPFSGSTAMRPAFYLPIVPISPAEDFGSGKEPVWPVDALDSGRDIHDPLSNRVTAVVKEVIADNRSGFWASIVNWFAEAFGIDGLIDDTIKGVVRSSLFQPLYDKQLLSAETVEALRDDGYL